MRMIDCRLFIWLRTHARTHGRTRARTHENSDERSLEKMCVCVCVWVGGWVGGWVDLRWRGHERRRSKGDTKTKPKAKG
jgi:hypothetical protein